MNNQKPSSSTSASFSQSMGKLEHTLHSYLVDKAPALPDNAKEAIVSIGPWVMLILILMSLPFLLFALGLGAIVAPFAFMGRAYMGASWGLGMMLSLGV